MARKSTRTLRRSTELSKYVILSALLVFALILMVVLRHGSYSFHVVNKSSMEIDECIVYLGEERFLYQNIKIDASVTEKVRIHRDTHFIVLVRLESGKEMYAELGYACAGAELAGEIRITNSDITLDNVRMADAP